jgi:putative transposase
MRFRFVEDHRADYPVRAPCAALGVSPSGFCAWRSRPESARAAEDRGLLEQTRQVHGGSGGRYGSPRVHAALRAGGRRVGRGRVERLMRRHGVRALLARPHRARTTDSRHPFPVAPHLLGRQFAAAAPNQVWPADLTYLPTAEGWLYPAAAMDLHSRCIVGWSMRDHPRAEGALAAPQMALQRQHPGPGLIHHPGRGVQCACGDHAVALEKAGITPSMSRRGNCLDDAPMEGFFHGLETELVHHRRHETHDQARRDVFACIEAFCDRQRLHSALGYRTPGEVALRAA